MLDNVFIATGASVFNGATIKSRSTIRINGVVHINTTLPEDSVIPIGWVAIGDPVEVLPPNNHDRISEIMKSLNFPKTVFGIDPNEISGTIMPEMTSRYSRALYRHKNDKMI